MNNLRPGQCWCKIFSEKSLYDLEEKINDYLEESVYVLSADVVSCQYELKSPRRHIAIIIMKRREQK